jgi:hypothetical protein
MLDDASFLDEDILEPIDEGNILRTVSDVLLGTDTPMGEVTAPLLDGPHREVSAVDRRDPALIDSDQERLRSLLQRRQSADYAAFTVARLLLPHLDFAA